VPAAFLSNSPKQGGAAIPVNDTIPSRPFFFRIIKRAVALLIVLLLLLAIAVSAPLQGPANMAETPNPAKAAWFFLWVQELLSYSKLLVYAVMLTGLYFLLLPYWPGSPQADRAKWLPREQLGVNIVTLTVFFSILALTGIAMFFRGENWAFVCPF
jgi:hypothetical protein